MSRRDWLWLTLVACVLLAGVSERDRARMEAREWDAHRQWMIDSYRMELDDLRARLRSLTGGAP